MGTQGEILKAFENADWRGIVFNTGETQEQLMEKYNRGGAQLRAIQLRMLDMLIYLDSVCKELGVQYRLDGGTVLGAVRHGGFIPWDDDLDVVVDDKKDYKRLCRYLINHEHPQYKLQCHKTDKGYTAFWCVLRDTKSEYIQEWSRIHNARKYRGLQIDIFPYDSGNFIILNKIAHKFTLLKDKFIGRINPVASSIYYLQKGIIHPIFNLISKLFGNKEICMHSYGTGWLFRVPKSVTLPYKPIEFEGHTFSGPAQPEKLLEILYGDWYSLPPAEQRDHHLAKHKIWD